MQKITLVIIIVILVFLYNNTSSPSSTEYFDIRFNNPIYSYSYLTSQIPNNTPATTTTAIAKHIRGDHFGRIDELTVKPPIPHVGETSCKRVPCRYNSEATTICWLCQ